MLTRKEGIDFNYTYKLEKGISNIHGGIKVLHDMDYPKEIIDNTENFM
jgi:DNA mismatch repair ATPase MutS